MTTLIVLVGGWHTKTEYDNTLNTARILARSGFEKDLIFRQWATGHGGIYAPVTASTPPNPYLAHLPHRDITTDNGVQLTLLNPAYITRQIHELGIKQFGYKSHITSINPIRSENAPDKWEKQALQVFAQGKTEVSELSKINNVRHMRFMSPLLTQSSCLPCHAAQGYKEGDLRGGISVSIPMAPLMSHFYKDIANMAIGYFLVWFIGLLGIGYTISRINLNQQELERSKKQIEKNEIRYRELAEHMEDGVAVYQAVDEGRDFTFCDHNLAGEQITGLSRQQVIGHRVTKVFPGVRDLGLLEVLQRVWKTGEAEIHPSSIYNDNRLSFWADNSVFKLPSGEVVAIYRDLTNEKIVEEKLNHANTIITRSPVAAFLWENSAGWPVCYVSENVLSILGYSAREFMNAEISYAEIIHPDDLDRVAGEVSGASSEESTLSFAHEPYRVISRDKRIIWVHDETHIRRNSQGQITHYEGIVYDISRRMQADVALQESKEQLRSSEAKFRNLVEFSTDWVWEVDREGLYTYASPQVENILGYKPEELIGKTVFDLMVTEEVDAISALFKESVEKGTPILQLENGAHHKNGQIIILETSGAPFFDEEGKVAGYRGMDRDITQRKKMALEKEELIGDLQKALDEIKTLRGILPLCSFCKKIRQDNDAWIDVDAYIHKHSEADISHSVCPQCAQKHYPDDYKAIYPDKDDN
ncbi:MAG: PAS domain S-box protein [Thermodesulfobacteriota bacterium]